MSEDITPDIDFEQRKLKSLQRKLLSTSQPTTRPKRPFWIEVTQSCYNLSITLAYRSCFKLLPCQQNPCKSDRTCGIDGLSRQQELEKRTKVERWQHKVHKCTSGYYSHYKYPAKTISCSICSHPTFSSSPPGRSASSLDGFGSGGTCRDRGTVMFKMWYPQPLKKRWRRLPPTQL